MEAYFADAADEWTANPENVLRRADGKPGGAALSLAALAPAYADGCAAAPGDVIESTRDDYTRQYGALRGAHQEFRNVIYGRVVPGGDDVWLQYWFFYFLNDYQLAWGVDVHEGDWEMVQLRMEGEPARSPPRSTPSTRSSRRARGRSVTKLADEKRDEGAAPEPGDEHRPLVYVGRGSHASFFEPGFHQTDFYDITDGRQRAKTETRLVDVTETPAWLGWPGPLGRQAHRATPGRARPRSTTSGPTLRR